MNTLLKFIFSIIILFSFNLTFAQIEFTEHILAKSDIPYPSKSKAIDLDKDNDTDIIVGDYTGKILWLKNEGSNNYSQELIFQDTTGVRSISIIDIDYDNDFDILYSTISDIYLLTNDGSFNFDKSILINEDFDDIYKIQAIDIDDDNDIDIIASVEEFIFDNFVYIYENDGSGNFTANETSILFEGEPAFVIADIDVDTDLDIIIKDANEKKTIWYEQTDTSFEIVVVDSGHSVGTTTPVFIEVNDIDNDNDLDIISAHSQSNKILLWCENLGGDQFAPETTLFEASSRFKWTSKFVDFNKDGKIDIVSNDQWDDTLQVYINTGDLSNFERHIVYHKTYRAINFNIFDSDNDGDNDIISVNHHISLHENLGSFNFDYQPLTSVGAASVQDVKAADIDKDGDMDLISGSYSDDKVTFFENMGNRTFESHILTEDIDEVSSIQIADLDGNNLDDILVSGDGTPTILLNQGNQNFSSQKLNASGTYDFKSTSIIDLDKDGELDIIGTKYSADDVIWLKNNGNLSFSKSNICDTVEWAYDAFPIDVDNDNDIDIFSASYWDDIIYLHKNDSSQNFTTEVIYDKANSVQCVLPVDIDKDGDIDVLTSINYIGDALVLLENTDTGYTELKLSTNVKYIMSIAVGDIDLDNDIDIVTASRDNNEIAWFENIGSNEFEYHLVTDSADNAYKVLVEDLDNDGDLDIAAVHRNSSTVAWYENSLNSEVANISNNYLTIRKPNIKYHSSCLFISLPQKDIGEISLFTLNGKRIFNKETIKLNSGKNIISLKKLGIAKGTYIVNVNLKNTKLSSKILLR